jgi:potassium efflux system protein
MTENVSVVPDSNPFTLYDFMIGGVLCFVVLVATRTLPALLDIAILSRIALSSGAHYAASTLMRYIVIIFGILLASRLLGISWSNVHWLVAALTFGLGFGLQEVFANFISGIIVLFEQPVRVGDIVTIGNVSGTVSRIRIRATTITDWDRKELIIPNKSLVTGNIVNWTLSHRILRARILVGVSYESNPEKVIAVLEGVASREVRITADPAPMVLLTNFGPSSLDFELIVFVADVSDNLIVQRDLRVAILHAFRSEGIEISFPQQDIHLKTSPFDFIPRRSVKKFPKSLGESELTVNDEGEDL